MSDAGKLGCCAFAEPPTDFFSNDRGFKRFAELLDLGQQILEIAITFWLDRFLKGVEVQDQRVGPDHIDGFAALIDAIAVIKLHSAEIGKQQNTRPAFAARLLGCESSPFYGRTLPP